MCCCAHSQVQYIYEFTSSAAHRPAYIVLLPVLMLGMLQ